MANNFQVTINHSDAKRMQSFINGVRYQLEEVPFDWHSWQLSDRIAGAMKFHTPELTQPAILTVLLCDSYADANAIGKANEMMPRSPHARWGANGAMLYFAESENEDHVSELVSWFAGKE